MHGYNYVMKQTLLTIINDENMRGVLAPKRLVSKEMLEDIIDLIELSTPESIKETEKRIREADRKKSWIHSKEVERRLSMRLKAARA